MSSAARVPDTARTTPGARALRVAGCVAALACAVLAPTLAAAQGVQTLHLRRSGTPPLQLTVPPPTETGNEGVEWNVPRRWETAAALGAPLRIRAGSVPVTLQLRRSGAGGATRSVRLELASSSLGTIASGDVTAGLGSSVSTVSTTLAIAADRVVPAGDRLFLTIAQTAPAVPSSFTRVHPLHVDSTGAVVYSTLALPADDVPAVQPVGAFDGAAPAGAAGVTFAGGATAYLRATVRTAFAGTPPPAVTLTVTDPAGVVRLANATPTLVAGAGTNALVHELAYALPADARSGDWRVTFSARGADGTASASATFAVLNVPPAVAEYRMDEASWSGVAGEVVDSARGLSGRALNGATTAGATPAVPGSPGTCRYGAFDGGSRYVQLPASLPRATGTTTISAWIRTTHTGGAKDQRVWVDDDSGDGYALSLGDGGAGRLRFFVRRPSLVVLDTDAVIQPNQWYFVAAVVDTAASRTVRLYVWSAAGTLLASPSAPLSAFQPGTGRVAIGGELDGAPDGEGVSRWRFAGSIDEVRLHASALAPADLDALRMRTRPCGGAVERFAIATSRSGLYCLDHAVTVTPVDGAGNPVASYAGQIVLDTSTARGTWLPQAGGGVLADAVADDGLATYRFPGGEASATFLLRYRQGAPVVDVDAYPVELPGSPGDDREGAILFAPSGFTVTSQPLVAPVAALPPFAPAVVAGADVPVYLTAYGQTPDDPQCGVIAGYAGAKPLQFWATRLDPATGSRAPTVDGVAIATTEAASAAQAVAFVAGQAVVSFEYKDVGRLALGVKDASTGNAQLPDGIRGASGPFVTRPADFRLTDVRRASDGVANPGATGAAGAVFVAAGRPFAATVTAIDADGDPVPNYGRESAPESVRLDAAVLLPVGGAAPPVAGTFGPFANGRASGTTFAWPEVGIVNLVPRVADGSYLGASDVVGTPAGPVGRFVPDRFEVATNVPVFRTACTAGRYTYVGQPFDYAVPPVATVTAVAAGGTPTTNYRGALFRLANATLGARTYAAGGAALDVSGLPPIASDPAIAEAGGGVATLTFGGGTGLAFARGAPVAPFDAQVSLAFEVIDADGVRAPGTVAFGAGGGIAFTAGAQQRYGRLLLRNAAGPEVLDLPVPLTTQYWLDAARGFTAHAADACTVAPALALADWRRALRPGDTCVRDAGSPGISGAGCAAPAPPGTRLRAIAVGGDFALRLAAPGASRSGAVRVEAVAPPWLRFDWDATAPGTENPSALATFGVFGGPPSRIYRREVY